MRRWLTSLWVAFILIATIWITHQPPRVVPDLAGTPGPATTASPISVTGDAKTGVSGFFAVTTSGLSVDWTVTVPAGGCAFSLILTTPENPQGGASLLPPTPLAAGKQSGQFDWEDVGPGTFILREDRTGLANCKGPWRATVTQHGGVGPGLAQ
jgi:hypothetical protein